MQKQVQHDSGAIRKFLYFRFINLWFFVAFLSIIVAGLFFRLYKMDCFPWGLEGLMLDTSYFGTYAFRILDGEPYTPIGCGAAGYHDTFFFYIYALFFSLFGPKLIVLRCGTVFIGFINAVLVFFTIKAVLRTYLGEKQSNGNSEEGSNIVLLALAGMGLYLFSSVDTVLNYSAFHATFTTPVALGGFLSLIWAFEKNNLFSFCFAGLLFGLLLSSSYYYIATAPAFIVVILYYALSNLFGRFRPVVPGWHVKLGIFFLGAIFVVLPKILYLLCNSYDYFYRTLEVVNVNLVTKERSLTTILCSLISKLSSPFVYDTIKLMFFDGFQRCKFLLGNSTIPIVDKLVIPVFALGLVYSLVKIRRERYLFMVCYLCFTLVHCIVSFPMDYRFIPFMPFVYIFSSIGLNMINKLLKYRKVFYILAGIYLIVIVSFNVKNYYTGMGVRPLESSYHVKNTLLGRYLQKNFLDKRVYVSLTNHYWITVFSTYNYRERDIDRPTLGVPYRDGEKKCNDFLYKKILFNISQIIGDNKDSKKDILFVFDDAVCNEEIVSHLETILNKKRSSFNIYSKSCKQNFLYSTLEIKKEGLAPINIASLVPQYTGKRYRALENIQQGKRVEGLSGKYYADLSFGKLVDTRIDKYIDFNWVSGSPLPSLKPDNFSIEWNGYINVDVDDVYCFFITSDDGARLWIDDDLIIDNWNPNVSDELSESVFLGKGFHKIKLQYFELEGLASVSLWWASERLWKAPVPHYSLSCVSED
ncbi:MAG TPA: PA14 domain-containing protein [Candidatus Brocadiia bacterium]|nr:PA14 domain-containing protein [Candidatus Brocadiales bacterium]